MGYRMKFEDVLLPGWTGWDGNGIGTIPGKNVMLENKTMGCILVSAEGVSVYSTTLGNLYESDEGEVFLDHVDTPDAIKNLELLSDKDKEDTVTVYNRFLERETTYTNE